MHLLLALFYALPPNELAEHADMTVSMQLYGGMLLAIMAK